MSLESILKEISAARAYEHIAHISGQIPSRLAGSANAQRVAEYAFDTFQKAGLDARMHKFLGLVSFPEPLATVAAPSFTVQA